MIRFKTLQHIAVQGHVFGSLDVLDVAGVNRQGIPRLRDALASVLNIYIEYLEISHDPCKGQDQLDVLCFHHQVESNQIHKKVEERYQVDGTSGIASKQYQPSRFPGHFMFAPKRK